MVHIFVHKWKPSEWFSLKALFTDKESGSDRISHRDDKWLQSVCQMHQKMCSDYGHCAKCFVCREQHCGVIMWKWRNAFELLLTFGNVHCSHDKITIECQDDIKKAFCRAANQHEILNCHWVIDTKTKEKKHELQYKEYSHFQRTETINKMSKVHKKRINIPGCLKTLPKSIQRKTFQDMEANPSQ